MEVIELPGVSTVDDPRLAGIQQNSKYYCTVYLNFGGISEASSVPDVFAESVKGSTGLCYPVVDLGIYDHRTCQGAAEIGEIVCDWEALPHSRDARL